MAAKSLLLCAIAPVAGKVYFKDTFEDLSKWTMSKWKTGPEMGEFELKAPDSSEDTALATAVDHRFYGASASFEPFSNDDKTLVVQFQARYDTDVSCGGGYIKIGPKLEDAEKFGDPTEYNIMFGPDKCGTTKRTHLIFSYKGKNVLKTVDLPYKQDKDKISNLYRLVVKPDNTVKVLVDKQEVYSGSLESDWKLLEPKEITDPDDKKPSDWVDNAMMEDPDDKKPDDWVEEKQIVDSEATKPEDWDAEEDGEWEAPMKANPDYKGDWKPKKISNPDYKGVWTAKKIPNPDYEANDALYKYKEFGFVGFDIWQVKAHAFFDNLLIADDEEEADKLADEWAKTVEKEKTAKETTTTTTTTEAADISAEGDTDEDDEEL
jgi:calreticulin